MSKPHSFHYTNPQEVSPMKSLSPDVDHAIREVSKKTKEVEVQERVKQDKKDGKKITDKQRIDRIEEFLGISPVSQK